MPANFTNRQLAFYRELFAPFAPDELSEKPGRGGKRFTFIDKRALMNRLDSICGPDGWRPEYRQFGPGLICALSLKVPTRSNSDSGTEDWAWVTKEDGAGPEEMQEVDNDIKSNFTNALRRTAQDAWGIGRYLYGKGIPSFLDPTASALPKVHSQSDGGKPEPVAPSKAPEKKAPATREPQTSATFAALPRSGTGVWPWAKEVERVFEIKIIDGLIDKGDELGFGRTTRNWNPEQTATLCMDAIKFLRGTPNYGGQFEHLFADGQEKDAIDVLANVDNLPIPTPAVTGDAYKATLTEAKKQLMNAMQALVQKQLGRTAEPVELKAALATISPAVTNDAGHKGEVCQSLSACDDLTWVQNMTKLVLKQIEMAQANPPDDDIPF